MNARDTRNGGEISGRRLMSDRNRFPGTVVRVTAYARIRATATVMTVETAETSRLLTRMRNNRQVLKNAAYCDTPRPAGPVKLSASTRTTGQTTKTSSSVNTTTAVTPTARSARAS